MRPVALIAAAIVAQSACGRRDSPDESVSLRYQVIDRTDPERARRALDELFEHRYPLQVRGDVIEVTFESFDAAMAGGRRVDDAERGDHTVEVRVVDYDSPYVTELGRYLAGANIGKLDVSVAIDPIGRHLRVPDSFIYVNEAWAKEHACEHAFHIEGSGYSCPVRPPDRLRAILHGEPGLFVDPPPAALAVPKDRMFLPAFDRTAWRYYLTYEPPIDLDGTAIASVDREGVALTTRGGSLLDTYASGSAVQLVVVVAGMLLPAQRDGARLRFTLDDRDASRIRRGLPFQGVQLQLVR